MTNTTRYVVRNTNINNNILRLEQPRSIDKPDHRFINDDNRKSITRQFHYIKYSPIN